MPWLQDVSESVEKAEIEKHEELLLRQQELDNLLLAKDYVRAVGVALSLDQPFRLLALLQGVCVCVVWCVWCVWCVVCVVCGVVCVCGCVVCVVWVCGVGVWCGCVVWVCVCGVVCGVVCVCGVCVWCGCVVCVCGVVCGCVVWCGCGVVCGCVVYIKYIIIINILMANRVVGGRKSRRVKVHRDHPLTEAGPARYDPPHHSHTHTPLHAHTPTPHTASLVRYSSRWNQNAKHCHVAQSVLAVLLGNLSQEVLLSLEGVGDHIKGFIPYTQRHLQRLDRLEEVCYRYKCCH